MVPINTRNMRSLPLDICLGPMICVTLDLGLPNGVDLITHERIISSRQLCSCRSAALEIRDIILTRISRPIRSRIERPAHRRALPLVERSVLSPRDWWRGAAWVAGDVWRQRPGGEWGECLVRCPLAVHFPAADGSSVATKELMAAQEQSIMRKGEWKALLGTSNCCYLMTFTVVKTSVGRASWPLGPLEEALSLHKCGTRLYQTLEQLLFESITIKIEDIIEPTNQWPRRFSPHSHKTQLRRMTKGGGPYL